MTLRFLCFVFAFAPGPISLAFTVPLFADRYVSGGGMGTALALVFSILIWLACLITTFASAGIHRSLAPLNVAPSIREQAQAERSRKLLHAILKIGAAGIFVGLSGVAWIMLPVSASGTSIALNEEELGFLAVNLLVIGGMIWIGANMMTKTERRIARFVSQEKTRLA